MKLLPGSLTLAAVLCLGGCGVTAEDEPEPIGTQIPTVTPTLASRPAPLSPCPPTLPQSSGSRQVQPSPPPTQ